MSKSCLNSPLAIEMRIIFTKARRMVQRTLRKIAWSDVKLLLAESMTCWSKHNAPRMGAALAFYALLSLMPLLLILISIAGLVYGASAAQTRVFEQVQLLIGIQRANILQAILHGAQNKADGVLATVVGTLILTFGATGVLVELREALNTIWEVPVRPLSTFQELAGMVKERLWSLALVLAIVVVLTASLLVSASITAIGTLTSALPAHEALLHLLNALVSFIAITIFFGAIYKVVPQAPIKWRDVILGAAVSAILFALGNFLLGLYLGKASFSSTYGAASSAVALAIWVYYSSQIFFLGAEFTRAFAQTYGSAPAGRIAAPGRY
jgi:membrane protein